MQFSWWQILILAVVQGVAEFLPISSDGHLVVLTPLLFGGRQVPPEMLDVTIVLHIGTLGSILVYYWRRILALLGRDRRTLGLIVLGTLPAVGFGLVMKHWFEPVLESPLLGGLMLPVTGLVLLWGLRCQVGETEYRDMTWLDSLWIGVCQATAILPGLSRSGTTIAAGLGRGLTRSSAATYSFLLAIPAVGGAGVLEAYSLWKEGGKLLTPVELLVAGAIVSFVVGLGSLALLERLLLRGQLQWFGWYCIVLGIAVVAWQIAPYFLTPKLEAAASDYQQSPSVTLRASIYSRLDP
jgi:undecaprenyl-diphosphatase